MFNKYFRTSKMIKLGCFVKYNYQNYAVKVGKKQPYLLFQKVKYIFIMYMYLKRNNKLVGAGKRTFFCHGMLIKCIQKVESKAGAF